MASLWTPPGNLFIADTDNLHVRSSGSIGPRLAEMLHAG